MNENLYITHKKIPHETLRVHSARYTQCIHVSSRKPKLPKDAHTKKYKHLLPTHPFPKVELYIAVYRPSRQLRSISDTRTFRIPFTKTKTFGQRAFSFTGPTQWNSLPYDVRHSVSTSSFKQALKTHLFKSAYN